MNYDQLRDLVLAKPGAVEEFPFGPDAMVPKVGGKMFAILTRGASPGEISLKVDPVHGELLRAEYPSIKPGYHLNKRHWVTLTADESVPESLIVDLIDESWELVFNSLTRAVRASISTS